MSTIGRPMFPSSLYKREFSMKTAEDNFPSFRDLGRRRSHQEIFDNKIKENFSIQQLQDYCRKMSSGLDQKPTGHEFLSRKSSSDSVSLQ